MGATSGPITLTTANTLVSPLNDKTRDVFREVLIKVVTPGVTVWAGQLTGRAIGSYEVTDLTTDGASGTSVRSLPVFKLRPLEQLHARAESGTAVVEVIER